MPQDDRVSINGPQVHAINAGFAELQKVPKFPRDLRSIGFWRIMVETIDSNYRVSFAVAREFETNRTDINFLRRSYYVRKTDFRIVGWDATG